MITVSTSAKQEMIDITKEVQEEVSKLNVHEGICTIFTPHATAAIIINENYDPNVCKDVLDRLEKLVPLRDDYLHDKVDGNAAAHIKAAILGPGQTVPVSQGRLQLGKWQSLMFVELDGPRSERNIIVKVVPGKEAF